METHALPPPSIQLATELKDVILLNVILKMVFANERRAGWKVGREPGDGIKGGVGGKRRRQELAGTAGKMTMDRLNTSTCG